MPGKIADQTNAPLKRTVLLAPDSSNSVIAEITDGAINTIGYSAYGEQSAQQAVATRLGFNGQLRETTIGWYLLGNGYRAYNPRLMRFHSPDNWSPFGGGGLNAYMYCVGDPVNRADPTGHWSINTILSKLVAFIGRGIEFNIPGPRTRSLPSTKTQARKMGFFQNMVHNKNSGAPNPRSPPQGDPQSTTPKAMNAYGGVGLALGLGSSSKPKSTALHQSTQSTRKAHGAGAKRFIDSSAYVPRREQNALQEGEVLPRKDYWQSNESISTTGSTWSNASNATPASSISSGRLSRASADIGDLEEIMSRLNQLERDASSGSSFHSAASSIRDS
ncbi:hypothetical protein D3C84_614160 [compost metagenome]